MVGVIFFFYFVIEEYIEIDINGFHLKFVSCEILGFLLKLNSSF